MANTLMQLILVIDISPRQLQGSCSFIKLSYSRRAVLTPCLTLFSEPRQIHIILFIKDWSNITRRIAFTFFLAKPLLSNLDNGEKGGQGMLLNYPKQMERDTSLNPMAQRAAYQREPRCLFITTATFTDNAAPPKGSLEYREAQPRVPQGSPALL